MGCYTGYLVRDADGLWRGFAQKRGRWRLWNHGDREATLAMVRKQGWALAEPSAYPWWSGCYCRGVLLDVVERRLRVYACAAEFHTPEVGWLECVERRFARAPAWAGWDVGYAWGGRDEFAALVPERAAQIVPEPWEQPSLDELGQHLGEREWLIAWDPEALRLRCRYEGYPAYGYPGLITVIDDTLRVADFACTASFEHGEMPWLTHGERLLDLLAREIPYPLLGESENPHGVIVDRPARVIRHWSDHALVPTLFEQIRAAWPGWQIERLRFGYTGHLAATGRFDPELLIPDAELDESFDPEWTRERAQLRNDPRPLRIIEAEWE